MPGTFRVYDPNEVIFQFGGADISAFGPGTFIQITQDADAFNVVVGAAGDVVRSKTNNKLATITVSIMQTSPDNDLLSTIYNTDQKARNGAGVAPLVVRDSATGRAVFAAASAWIHKAPDVTFDQQDTPRQWVFKAAALERFDAGT